MSEYCKREITKECVKIGYNVACRSKEIIQCVPSNAINGGMVEGAKLLATGSLVNGSAAIAAFGGPAVWAALGITALVVGGICFVEHQKTLRTRSRYR